MSTRGPMSYNIHNITVVFRCHERVVSDDETTVDRARVHVSSLLIQRWSLVINVWSVLLHGSFTSSCAKLRAIRV